MSTGSVVSKLALCVAAGALCACGDLWGPAEVQVIGTLSNQAGDARAIHYAFQTGGAAGGSDQRIDVEADGARETVLIFDTIEDVQVVWKDANTLNVSMLCAETYSAVDHVDVAEPQRKTTRRIAIEFATGGSCEARG